MKKEELIKKLKELGWWFLKEGGNHEIWTNGKQKIPVARHCEIKKSTSLGIIKKAKKQ